MSRVIGIVCIEKLKNKISTFPRYALLPLLPHLIIVIATISFPYNINIVLVGYLQF